MKRSCACQILCCATILTLSSAAFVYVQQYLVVTKSVDVYVQQQQYSSSSTDVQTYHTDALET